MKICHDCSKLSKLGYGRCQRHLDLHSVQQKKYMDKDREKYNEREVERKQKRIENSFCRSCGRIKDPDADEGHVECMNCRLRLTRRI